MTCTAKITLETIQLTLKFLTIDDFDLEGKTVFLRVDVNSPIDPSNQVILDDSRIRETKETLDSLKNAKVVLGSHQSRPGKEDFTTLEEHADLLRRYCSQDVTFVEDVMGPAARNAIRELKRGQVLVLDNLRICSEEVLEAPPEKLAKTMMIQRLAPLCDFYVNDAFAAAHRAQASLVGFAYVLPAAAGRLMEKELGALNSVLWETKHPCTYALGGAKVEDKLPVIEHILKSGKADTVVLGGLMAKVFLRAQGFELGRGDQEELTGLTGDVQRAKNILDKYSNRIKTPLDLATLKNSKRVEAPVKRLNYDEPSLDIGSETTKDYTQTIKASKTVVANGPMGVFEKEGFDIGTKTVLEAIASCKGTTIIGGGHLAGLANMLEIEDRFSHVSTAGGAMLSMLAGETLPGIEALIRAAEKYKRQSS
jgi:phosphoglycerate kinase